MYHSVKFHLNWPFQDAKCFYIFHIILIIYYYYLNYFLNLKKENGTIPLIEEKYEILVLIDSEKNENDEVLKKYSTNIELLLYIEDLKKKILSFSNQK